MKSDDLEPLKPVFYPKTPKPGSESPEDLTQRSLLQAIELSKAQQQLEIDRQELRHAEEKIQSLARFSSENPNPILRIDGDGKLLYANPPALKLMQNIDVVHGDFVAYEYKELALQSLAENAHKNLEVEFSDKIYSLEFTPIESQGYVNVYGHDITEQKQAKVQLSVQYELVKIFAEAESVDEAMPKILETAGRFLRWDMSFFWELKPNAEVLRCRCSWSSEDLSKLSAWKEFEQATLETEFEKGTGLPGRIWSSKEPAWIPDIASDENFPRAPYAAELEICSGYGFPIFSKSGFVGVIEFFTRRISQMECPNLDFMASLGSQIGQFAERKFSQQAVLQERKNLYAMLNHLPVSLHAEAADRSIRVANTEFRRQFGDPESSDCRSLLLQRSSFEGNSSLLEAFTAERGKALVWKAPNGSVYLSLQTEFEDLDGSPLNLEMSIDMTRQVEAEERLRVFAQKLEHSNKELEDFASIASHDLKEPLRKIVTLGDFLKEKAEGIDPVIGDYVNRMQDATIRMTALIQDLLEYSRVSRQEGQMEMVDLETIVQETREALEVALKKTGGDIIVESLPTLEADPSRMRQLFQNLLGNSLKYHRPGVKPVVRIQSASDGKGGWRIQLQDNGIGFEQKYADRVLRPFERLHSKSAFEGSGMGLAICKKIVDRHNGAIRIESEPDKGCSVILDLPLTQP